MSARIRKLHMNDEWRQKIQTTMLIKRLQDHIVNKIKLETTQIKAIEILLRKVAPDLAHIDGNLNIVTRPEARVYPIAPTDDNKLPAPSQAMDSVH